MSVSATAANPGASLLNNLSELLTRHVQEQPERTAVGTSDGGIAISYGELDALVQSAMAQLSRLGVGRGTTVALVSDNCVEFVVGLLAVVSLGARVAPFNPALTLPELSSRLSELSAHAVLAPKTSGRQARVCGGHGRKHCSLDYECREFHGHL